MKGSILVEVDPLSQEDTERYRQIILLLIANGIFQIRNGNATIHFDSLGIVQQIQSNIVRYKRQATKT